MYTMGMVLRHRRQRKGFTVAALCALTGIMERRYRKIEKDEVEILFQEVCDIAYHLDMTADDFSLPGLERPIKEQRAKHRLN